MLKIRLLITNFAQLCLYIFNALRMATATVPRTVLAVIVLNCLAGISTAVTSATSHQSAVLSARSRQLAAGHTVTGG